MKKLFHQMMKFGLVGVICFVIDYITGLIVLNVLMALFTDCLLYTSDAADDRRGV